MTPRQRKFVAAYLKEPNATKAAKFAGYSKKTAYSIGQRMLSIPEIKAAIEAPLKKLEISAERVLAELAKMAFLDPRKFFNDDGSLKRVRDLDDQTAASLAGIEHEKLFEHYGKGQAKQVGATTKIKIADKGINLERLGRHLKLFTDKIEHSGLDTLAAKIAASRARITKRKHA